MKNIYHIIMVACTMLAFSCTPTPEDVTKSDLLPNIYPDYTDITIPVNIAPLNFLLRGNAEVVLLKAECEGKSIEAGGNGNAVTFGIDEWKALMSHAAGKDVDVTITAMENGKWTEYKSFKWTVANDSIDPYLTYRLIEPDYEVFNNLQIQQRCIENFKERNICDYNLVGNRCMNCHAFSNQNPDISMMYVRGKGGGAIFNKDGKLRKLGLKKEGMKNGSVYFSISPKGRYIVFSANNIVPAFHSEANKRLEVYDTTSDLYIADTESNRIFTSPLICDSTSLETFPTFSPDGKYIYYCTAKSADLKKGLQNVHYALVRVPFNDTTGKIGDKADTIRTAPKTDNPEIGASNESSISHPRISPDGRYVLYTVSDYGTFPIWHREADLRMLDLKTGKINMLNIVNSDKSDTYHSWSSNSRWFVFASKRDDGLYGKPYFCYVDRKGNAHKPFVLPQENPDKYDNILKSFNIPELSRGQVPFTAADVQEAMQKELESFK